MDRKVRKIIAQPNYHKIYSDILEQKFPDKIDDCKVFLEKKTFSALEIITLNQIIFGKEMNTENINAKHRSYDEKSIKKILAFQQKNNMNNSELSKFYKISRNSVTKWKKLYG